MIRYYGMKYDLNYVRLADAMFPNISETIEDLEGKYPQRQLKEGAEVTRFAPSPTGFLHTGSLFTAMIAEKFARQSGGVFFVRLEDTDSKREVSGSDMALITQMAEFGIRPHEGFGATNRGDYGPYRQSERERIYKTVIKEMVRRGDAYPCFATSDELDELRRQQEAKKIVPGYYGPFAKYRQYPVLQALDDVSNGRPFVVRFKSKGQHHRYIQVFDEVRGKLSLSENDQDIVILKSDGLPTYHFAHVVDDHFMKTTIVTRGEEWLASLPIHVEMFERLEWKAPRFAHLPVIMKLDDGKKRKLSKRKDSEAAVSFFLEQGYPVPAVIEYLMTIANSNFEEWRIANPSLPLDDFQLSFNKMSLDGALFDLQKVVFLSKEYLAKLKATQLVIEARTYAEVYHKKLADLIKRDPIYFTKIVNIEREKDNPRKDYFNYRSIYDLIHFFYDDYYEQAFDTNAFNPLIDHAIIIAILTDLKAKMTIEGDESAWFAELKEIGAGHHFAASNKIFKQNPSEYIGTIGDVAEILRIAITGLKQTPNLFQIMHVLGIKEVHRRLEFVIAKLS